MEQIAGYYSETEKQIGLLQERYAHYRDGLVPVHDVLIALSNILSLVVEQDGITQDVLANAAIAKAEKDMLARA